MLKGCQHKSTFADKKDDFEAQFDGRYWSTRWRFVDDHPVGRTSCVNYDIPNEDKEPFQDEVNE